ncbi:hypothetical protein OAA06_01605 [bacterium]|nr:hypothetical protein [bacterium]
MRNQRLFAKVQRCLPYCQGGKEGFVVMVYPRINSLFDYIKQKGYGNLGVEVDYF